MILTDLTQNFENVSHTRAPGRRRRRILNFSNRVYFTTIIRTSIINLQLLARDKLLEISASRDLNLLNLVVLDASVRGSAAGYIEYNCI